MTLFFSGNLSFINSASFPVKVSAEKICKLFSILLIFQSILLLINGNILIIDSGCFPINRHSAINTPNSNMRMIVLINIIIFLG